ncbi:MAG: tail fiber domain-containing protein [Bacteroidota bacterium]
MPNYIKILLLFLFTFCSFWAAKAQVGINENNADPDASAMLDVSSSDKGFLIPRMTTAERTAIATPATGLMVYDNEENSFWYYNGTAWTAIGQDVFTSENNITHSISNDDDFVFGADSLNYGSGDEYKFFFDKSKGAFRAGLIENADWDKSNIGDYSAAFGENHIGSGEHSFAGGKENILSGDYAAAFGYYNEITDDASFAAGQEHIIKDEFSAAFGYYNQINGYASFAAGEYHVVNGDYAAAFGQEHQISGYGSFATGYENIISGAFAGALGRYLSVPSYTEVAIGTYNTTYTANRFNNFDSLDRAFVIGNGINAANRSDAMIVYKSGNTEINGNVTVRDSLTINKESFFNEQVTINESQGGITFFPLVVSNDNNANNAFNNGIQIIAGQESAVINNEKLAYFLQFITPDGTEIGSIRQASGSDVSFNTTSDVRLKSNIQATNYGLQDILNIDVRDYHYTSDASETPRTGFLAQQLYEVFPMAVTKGGDDAKTNPWTVDYSKLTPLLVKGMQDQQVQIEELQVENEKLKAQIDKISQLEMMLHQLQAQINQEDSNTATIISEEK